MSRNLFKNWKTELKSVIFSAALHIIKMADPQNVSTAFRDRYLYRARHPTCWWMSDTLHFPKSFLRTDLWLPPSMVAHRTLPLSFSNRAYVSMDFPLAWTETSYAFIHLLLFFSICLLIFTLLSIAMNSSQKQLIFSFWVSSTRSPATFRIQYLGKPNIGFWNLLQLLQIKFSQKEVLYGNDRDFQNFKLPSFMLSIIVRQLDMMKSQMTPFWKAE